MKFDRVLVLCLFTFASLAFAGIEGTYKSTNSDTILRINADGTASHRALTSVTRYKDFERASKDSQSRQEIQTSVSTGRWSTNETKLLFEGDALITLEIKAEATRTERTPLAISFLIETNGDLVSSPGESTARLVKQTVASLGPPASDAHNAVKVGLNFALSGPDAALDASGLQAAQLFVDELNDKGGIRIAGRAKKLEMIVRDNASDPAKAVEATKKFVEEDGVIAVIGPNASGLACPVAEAAENLKCTLICPWSTRSTLTKSGLGGFPRRYIFRVCFTDDQEMEVLASYASTELKGRTAAVLGGGIHASLFPKCFEKNGGQVVATEPIPKLEDDSPAFSKVWSASPDVLFINDLSKEGVDKIKKWGINARLLGGDNWNRAKELIRELGDRLNGAYFATHFAIDSTDPSTAAFKRIFKKRYGTDPDEIAALTYDAFALLAEAIKRADVVDRDKIRDELGNLWSFRGVTGSFTYKNPPYDPVKSVFIVRVDKGETRLAKEVRP